MIKLTANAAKASTTAGAPSLNVYEIPAASNTAVLRSVSANTCFESKDLIRDSKASESILVLSEKRT